MYVCVLTVCLAVFVSVCGWWMSRSSVCSNLSVSEGGLVHSSHVSLLTYYSIDNISLSLQPRILRLCSPFLIYFLQAVLSSFLRHYLFSN